MQDILAYQAQTYQTMIPSKKKTIQEDVVQFYTKLNRIRRNRGYSFEHVLVQKLNNNNSWRARRLGGI